MIFCVTGGFSQSQSHIFINLIRSILEDTYTRGGKEKCITEGQFADDSTLSIATYEVAERAISLHHSVARSH